MSPTTNLTFVALALFLYGTSGGQEHPTDSLSPSPEQCRITITSNVAHAIVILDGKQAGTTPCVFDTLLPGIYHIKVLHPERQSWLMETFDDSVKLTAGEKREVSYTFHPRFTITSDPFDATVFAGDSALGQTPLVIQTHLNSPALRIVKPGFETASLLLPAEDNGFVSVTLKSTTDYGSNETEWKSTLTSDHNTRWPLYLTGATSILSGALAAYFKVKADNSYSQYRLTGDAAFLSKTDRLDTGAAVALIATQINLGLFTYFILSE